MHNVNNELKEREDKVPNGYDKTVAQPRAHESRKDFLDSNNWIGDPAAPSGSAAHHAEETGRRIADSRCGFRNNQKCSQVGS